MVPIIMHAPVMLKNYFIAFFALVKRRLRELDTWGGVFSQQRLERSLSPYIRHAKLKLYFVHSKLSYMQLLLLVDL